MACVHTHINSFVYFSFSIALRFSHLFPSIPLIVMYLLFFLVFSLCSLWTSGRHSRALNVVLGPRQKHTTQIPMSIHIQLFTLVYLVFIWCRSNARRRKKCVRKHITLFGAIARLLISDRKGRARAHTHSFCLLSHALNSFCVQHIASEWPLTAAADHLSRNKVWEKNGKSFLLELSTS